MRYKIGKYVVDDWVKYNKNIDKDYTRFDRCIYIADNIDLIIGHLRVGKLSVWQYKTSFYVRYSSIFAPLHRKIFGFNKIEFNSVDEAKDYVDKFLDKLLKLKCFL